MACIDKQKEIQRKRQQVWESKQKQRQRGYFYSLRRYVQSKFDKGNSEQIRDPHHKSHIVIVPLCIKCSLVIIVQTTVTEVSEQTFQAAQQVYFYFHILVFTHRDTYILKLFQIAHVHVSYLLQPHFHNKRYHQHESHNEPDVSHINQVKQHTRGIVHFIYRTAYQQILWWMKRWAHRSSVMTTDIKHNILFLKI